MLYLSSTTSPMPDWQFLQIVHYPKYQFQYGSFKISPHDPRGIEMWQVGLRHLVQDEFRNILFYVKGIHMSELLLKIVY